MQLYRERFDHLLFAISNIRQENILIKRTVSTSCATLSSSRIAVSINIIADAHTVTSLATTPFMLVLGSKC